MIRPTVLDRVRSRLTGVPPRAYATRRLAREDYRVLEAKRSYLNQRLAEDIELLDRYVNPIERYMDGNRLLSPLGTILDRRSGKNLPLVWTELDLREFRRWSRIMCDINCYAIGFLNLLVNYHIRLGYTWHAYPRGMASLDDVALSQAQSDPLVRLAQSALDEWRDVNSWAIKSREGFRRWRRDGEVFLRFFRGDRWGLPNLRFIEPEQVGPPPGDDADGRWSFGVQTDPQDVMSIKAYFVRHPMGTGSDGDIVSSDRIIHLKANVDSTIKRGLPDFLPMQEDLDRVRRMMRNMGVASTVQSAIAWVNQYALATPQQVATMIAAGADYSQVRSVSGNGKLIDVVDYEPGSVLHIDDNRQFVAGPTSDSSAGFISVAQAILRGAGFRWNFPEFVSGDASNSNFASTLVAGAPMVNAIEAGQQEWGVLERATAIKILQLCVESGRLPAAVLHRVDVKANAPSVVLANRQEENAIHSDQHSKGLLSITTWRQKAGLNNDQEDANFAAEAKKKAALSPTDSGTGNLSPATGNSGSSGSSSTGGNPANPLASYGGIFSEEFTGIVTDSAGHKRKYVNGKQVAMDNHDQVDDKGGSHPGDQHTAPTLQDVTHGLADALDKVDPELKKKPGLLARLGDATLTVAAKANLFLLRHQGKIDILGEVLGAVLDTPADMQKFGYQPSASGGTVTGDAGKHMDAISNLTGGNISTHLAVTIASKALLAAFKFAKSRGAKKESAETGDPIELAAELLDQVFAATNDALGLTGAPDAAAIAAVIRKLRKSSPAMA